MNSEYLSSYCGKLKTIPQFSGTCWLNGILTVILYSNGLRNVMIKNLKSYKKDPKDKLFNFILFMLKNNNNIDNYDDFKPEYLLLSYLEKYNPLLKNVFKERIIKTNFNYNNSFIFMLLKSYNINYINLFYHNNNLYYNHNYNNHNYNKDYYDIIFISKNLHEDDIKGLKKENKVDITYTNNSPIIIINDTSYILDSCLISNYNNISHTISGITCNNNYYIFDSINSNYKEVRKNSKKIKFNLNPCKPYKYNWISNNKFCINTNECNIENDSITRDDILCYDLNKSDTILIYVKITSDMSLSPILFNESKLSYIDFNFSKESISLKVKEIYEKLKTLNKDQLYSYLIQIGYKEKSLLLLRNIRGNYGFLYQKLMKKKIINNNNDLLFREISLKLIFKYLKKGIIYDLENYTDLKTIYTIINYFSLKDIRYLQEYLNNHFDYNKIYIDLINKNILAIYKDLFTDNEDFYDNYIRSKCKNKHKKCILVKIIIQSHYLKRKYKQIIVNINHKKLYGKSPLES